MNGLKKSEKAGSQWHKLLFKLIAAIVPVFSFLKK